MAWAPHFSKEVNGSFGSECSIAPFEKLGVLQQSFCSLPQRILFFCYREKIFQK